MPDKASQLLDEMSVDPERRTLDWAVRRKDGNYGILSSDPRTGVRVKSWDTIFPPLPAADYSDQEMNELLAEVVERPSTNRTNKMTELLAMEARLGEAEFKAMLQTRREKRKRLQKG
jgi:hypothetical protein